MALVLSLVWLVAVLALLARAVRQRRAFRVLQRGTVDPAAAPTVAIIVPVRNEALNVRPCLETLLTQDYSSAHRHIVVVDDRSSDGTGDIVRGIAGAKLVEARELPRGWVGKANACWTGVLTLPAGVDWLCFVDADVRAEPAALSSAIAAALREKADFLSLVPRQELVSFWERLLMPCGFYLLPFVQDLARFEDPASDAVSASGPFLLVRRELYDRIGGHAAVRVEFSEDLWLAKLAKRLGARVLLLGGDNFLSCRMYRGWRPLKEGGSRMLTEMLGGVAPALMTASAAVLIAWTALALPVYLALDQASSPGPSHLLALVLAALASAIVLGFHVAGARHFRIPAWYGLLFPIAYGIGAILAFESALSRARGEVSWRGRTYDLSPLRLEPRNDENR